jgi:hypothetical protein
MQNSTHLFPAPRRKQPHKTEHSRPVSRSRSIIYIIIGVAIFIAILYGVTIITNLLGYHQLSLGLLLITTMVFWVSLGVGLMLGLTYFVMQILIKHEFKRRYDRSYQSRKARMQQMTRRKEANEETR